MSRDNIVFLPRSTPESQGLSSAAILRFIETADKDIDALHSFMLVRHGHVVAEGSWTPYEAQIPHVLYSLSKSFTATAVGLAVAQGQLSLDDSVIQFFPEDAPTEPSANLLSMRVRDLLRMATGHQTEPALRESEPKPELVDNRSSHPQMHSSSQPETWTRKFLVHPVPFKPGTHFLYNSPATYVLSAIVQQVTGMTVLDYLKPRLFEPLGFENPVWETSPQGVTVGAYGLLCRTEEIARFGQLYLQKGRWQDRQLLPEDWVEAATSLQTANGSAPQSDWDQGYGYQFWRCRYNAYRGDGAFGQYCLVLPEQDALVAITSGVRNMQAVLDLVWDHLLPAMQPASLPEDDVARHSLETKLASLMLRLPSGQITTSLTSQVSGRWYEFPANDRNVQAVALNWNQETPTLIVRANGNTLTTPIGVGTWVKSRNAFTSGLDEFLSVPENPLVAASGIWTEHNVFTIKIALLESPFYSMLGLHFVGDQMLLDTEYNVAFGPTSLPRLEGRATTRA